MKEQQALYLDDYVKTVSPKPPHEFWSNEVALMQSLKLKSTQQQVHFVTTHLLGHPAKRHVRDWQAQVITDWAMTLCSPSDPLVICGDMNAAPDSDLYSNFNSGGFSSGYASVFGSEPPVTFLTETIRGTMDYMFLKGPIRATAGVKIDTPAAALPSGSSGSDHLPLILDITYNITE